MPRNLAIALHQAMAVIRMFADRKTAGRELASQLAGVVNPARTVVAAIPRGGVAVALPIVERLGAPLAIVYARKLTVPRAPELAIGALDEDDHVLTEPRAIAGLGVTEVELARAKTRVATEIRRRIALYQAPTLASFLPDRDVVLVDDGLATGLTMRAAIEYARRHGARHVMVAVPCASSAAVTRFRGLADRVVSLVVDPHFEAVGDYYLDFSPIADAEVVAMLGRARTPEAYGVAVQFTNTRGGRLAGRLLVPDRPGPHPAVAVAHGWGSSMASPRNVAVAQVLLAVGVAVLLFDFTGHGASDGTPEDSTPAQQKDDLRAALDLLERMDDIDAARLGVAAASSGAAVALNLAAEDKRIRVLALRSPNVEGAEDAAEAVAVPTLLVVGEHDAPIRAMCDDIAPKLARARLEVVPHGDHLFEEPEALARAAALTVAWLTEHLRAS